jgi:hypothetical protein
MDLCRFWHIRSRSAVIELDKLLDELPNDDDEEDR